MTRFLKQLLTKLMQIVNTRSYAFSLCPLRRSISEISATGDCLYIWFMKYNNPSFDFFFSIHRCLVGCHGRPSIGRMPGVRTCSEFPPWQPTAEYLSLTRHHIGYRKVIQYGIIFGHSPYFSKLSDFTRCSDQPGEIWKKKKQKWLRKIVQFSCVSGL